MPIARRTRLYCGYDQNTNETTSLQGVFERFPYSSTGITTWRSEGSPEIVIDPAMTRFTWSGKPTWFRVDSMCNVYKGSGGNANRNIRFCWYLNGAMTGICRDTHMSAQDDQIVTGVGFLHLNTGDYIEPWISNQENDDKVLLKNCVFIFTEESGW